MKQRVLFVMTSMYNGGAEKSLVNLLNELNPNDFDVDLLLLKKMGILLPQIPEWVNVLEPSDGIQLMYTPETIKGHVGTKLLRLSANAVIKTLIRRDCYARAFRWKYVYSRIIEPLDKEYDVSVAYITGELLYFICEKTKARRKVLWVHNDYLAEDQPKEFDMPYMAKTDAIVTISERCANILRTVFPMFKDKVHEIHNITSSVVTRKQSEEFFPTEYKKGQFTIVSIGRLAKQKGFDWAIQAARILKDQKVDFSWFILGTGALEKELLGMMDDLDVGDVIHLIGSRENPYPYIKNADILVQSSRYEGKSIVLDETKILGTPIVVTDYETVHDQIIDGKEGIIVPMTPEGIALGVQEMMEDREKYDRIHQYLLDHEYGNQDEVAKYIDVLSGGVH